MTSTGFNAQFQRDINGTATEFVYQRFANKWFVIITQYGKLANLYTVKFDVKLDEALPGAMQGPVNDADCHMSVVVTMSCNFGADKDEVRSGIQFLLNKTPLNRCSTELLISLGLKEISGKQLREVAKVLEEILK